jgi:hypothetical protein
MWLTLCAMLVVPSECRRSEKRVLYLPSLRGFDHLISLSKMFHGEFYYICCSNAELSLTRRAVPLLTRGERDSLPISSSSAQASREDITGSHGCEI